MQITTEVIYPGFAYDDKNKRLMIALGGSKIEMNLSEAREFVRALDAAIAQTEEKADDR